MSAAEAPSARSPAERAAADGETVVLGAGPGGLAAAYALARAGRKPIVLERSAEPGGLMRGIRQGDFQVDLGRKEIYERIPAVVSLWEELLGADYRVYPHRIGILYEGRILERSARFRGMRRGIPPAWLARAAASFLRAQIASLGSPPPANYEEYWHRSRGEFLCRMLVQGFNEKFYGSRWRDRPVAAVVPNQPGEAGSLAGAVRALVQRGVASPEQGRTWRHPRRGTGQITRALADGIVRGGGSLMLGADVRRLDRGPGGVTAVHYAHAGGETSLPVRDLVSAIPVRALAGLLGLGTAELAQSDYNERRVTLLLYLFADAPPRFPHAWLDVTCPRMSAGRITSYANFGGDMVPAGQSCLSVEVFAAEGDAIPALPEAAVRDRLVREIAAAGLLDPARLTGHLLLRMPGAEASNHYRTWHAPAFRSLGARLSRVPNLYDVNRAGTDVAAYAGLEAAGAIVRGDRARFDVEADPGRGYTNAGPVER